jgi:D-sedoheptulose 7-phosphate isomerase
MDQQIIQRIKDLKAVLDAVPCECGASISNAAELIVDAYTRQGCVFVFGNGGSAADAQHIVGELNGRFLKERQPLKAQSLVGDSATLTAIANDYGYEQVFSRQLEANGAAGDVAWGISTSGNSPNVVGALRLAKEKGLKTIVLTGGTGGACAELADVLICVPSDHTPHVQEAGVAIYHLICELVEARV